MVVLSVVQNTVFKKAAVQASSLTPQDKASVAAGQTFEIRYAFRAGNHCFVELAEPLGSAGRVGYFFLPHVQVSLQELRAVWLTNVDSEILTSRSNLEQGLAALKALGFNTLYPAVWNRGFTLYPSPIAQALTGSAVMPNSCYENRDMLAELIEVAQQFNFRVIPWFEYGLKAPPNSSIAIRNQQLITTDQQQNPIKNGAVWLNPTYPEVQQFMVDLIADVADRYEIAGVQLDDNFGLPIELGYDSFTQLLYRQENREQFMPLNPRDLARSQWLTDKITDLFRQIFTATKSKRSCLISLSPNPLGFSRQNYAVDWQLWEQEGLVEELALQVYRSNLSSFLAEIDKPEVISTRFHVPTTIGVLTGLRTRSVSFNQLREQVQAIRQKQFAGMSCFFYETLLNEQLSPQKTPRNLADLQTLFPIDLQTGLQTNLQILPAMLQQKESVESADSLRSLNAIRTSAVLLTRIRENLKAILAKFQGNG